MSSLNSEHHARTPNFGSISTPFSWWTDAYTYLSILFVSLVENIRCRTQSILKAIILIYDCKWRFVGWNILLLLSLGLRQVCLAKDSRAEILTSKTYLSPLWCRFLKPLHIRIICFSAKVDDVGLFPRKIHVTKWETLSKEWLWYGFDNEVVTQGSSKWLELWNGNRKMTRWLWKARKLCEQLQQVWVWVNYQSCVVKRFILHSQK